MFGESYKVVLLDLFHSFFHEGLHLGCSSPTRIRHFFIVQFHNNINCCERFSLNPKINMQTSSKYQNAKVKWHTKIEIILNWSQRRVYCYLVHVTKKKPLHSMSTMFYVIWFCISYTSLELQHLSMVVRVFFRWILKNSWMKLGLIWSNSTNLHIQFKVNELNMTLKTT